MGIGEGRRTHQRGEELLSHWPGPSRIGQIEQCALQLRELRGQAVTFCRGLVALFCQHETDSDCFPPFCVCPGNVRGELPHQAE